MTICHFRLLYDSAFSMLNVFTFLKQVRVCVFANLGSLNQLLYAVRHGRADHVLDLLDKRAYTESHDHVRVTRARFPFGPCL
jgi:hypothetical protein